MTKRQPVPFTDLDLDDLFTDVDTRDLIESERPYTRELYPQETEDSLELGEILRSAARRHRRAAHYPRHS